MDRLLMVMIRTYFRVIGTVSVVCFMLFQPEPSFSQSSLIPQYQHDLSNQITGKTLEGFYQYQDVITGNHSYSETYHDDGTLTYKEEGEGLDKGKWWISKNQLCHHYDIDVPKIDHCFYIYKEGNCFYFYESKFKQTGRAEHSSDWTNRAIIRGEGKTCELPMV